MSKSMGFVWNADVPRTAVKVLLKEGDAVQQDIAWELSEFHVPLQRRWNETAYTPDALTGAEQFLKLLNSVTNRSNEYLGDFSREERNKLALQFDKRWTGSKGKRTWTNPRTGEVFDTRFWKLGIRKGQDSDEVGMAVQGIDDPEDRRAFLLAFGMRVPPSESVDMDTLPEYSEDWAKEKRHELIRHYAGRQPTVQIEKVVLSETHGRTVVLTERLLLRPLRYTRGMSTAAIKQEVQQFGDKNTMGSHTVREMGIGIRYLKEYDGYRSLLTFHKLVDVALLLDPTIGTNSSTEMISRAVNQYGHIWNNSDKWTPDARWTGPGLETEDWTLGYKGALLLNAFEKVIDTLSPSSKKSVHLRDLADAKELLETEWVNGLAAKADAATAILGGIRDDLREALDKPREGEVDQREEASMIPPPLPMPPRRAMPERGESSRTGGTRGSSNRLASTLSGAAYREWLGLDTEDHNMEYGAMQEVGDDINHDREEGQSGSQWPIWEAHGLPRDFYISADGSETIPPITDLRRSESGPGSESEFDFDYVSDEEPVVSVLETGKGKGTGTSANPIVID